MTITKIVQIPFKVSTDEKEAIDLALLKAKKENHLFTRTSFIVWLVKRYLNEKD